MRVYIAAPYAARDRVTDSWLPALRRINATSTASWLEETHQINDGTVGAAPGLTDAAASEHAQQDFEDIASSEVLLLLTADYLGVNGTSGGRHVETGYALARGLHVIVVGEPENVFHRVQSGAVEVVQSFIEALTAIQQLEIRRLKEQLAGERA